MRLFRLFRAGKRCSRHLFKAVFHRKRCSRHLLKTVYSKLKNQKAEKRTIPFAEMRGGSCVEKNQLKLFFFSKKALIFGSVKQIVLVDLGKFDSGDELTECIFIEAFGCIVKLFVDFDDLACDG